MNNQVKIDEEYTYNYSEGHVDILRHGQDWLCNPIGNQAWIAAANEIEELRKQVDDLRDQVEFQRDLRWV